MAERQRRSSRPNRARGGGGPASEGDSLDTTRQEIEGILDASERTLDSVGPNVTEAQGKDQVPPGTFHTLRR